MKSLKELKEQGRTIAAQLGVDRIFATADGQYFRTESYAALHSRNSGDMKVHELVYGDGDGGPGAAVTGEAAQPASATAPTATSRPKEEQPARKAPAPVKDVVAAIAAAKDAKQLAAAIPQGDVRPEVLNAAKAKRSELVKGTGPGLEKIKGIGAATAEKLRTAGVTTIRQLSGQDAAKLAQATGLNRKLLAKAISAAKDQH